MGISSDDDVAEVGFAKLQGEDFEFYMQTYSILLGRNSKSSSVDVDLATLGGGMNISRHHARIFYDFTRRHFALEVLGKNGCYVDGVLHFPGNPPVKLDSQDLLRIGDIEFYFLLPSRSFVVRWRPYPIPRSMAPPGDSSIGTCSNDDDDSDDSGENGESGGKKKKMSYDGNEGYGYSGKSSIA